MKKLLCILILLCLSMVQEGLYAQSKIEGVAVDSKGVPLPDGERLMTFLIYDGSESDTPLWSEQQKIVIEGGRFTAKLGSATPFDLPDDRSYWLGMRVGDGEELSPRLLLGSTDELGEAASVVGGWDDDGTVVRLSMATDLVGIGTTSPIALLDIEPSSTVSTPVLRTGGTSSNSNAVMFNTTNSNNSVNASGVRLNPLMIGSGDGMQGVTFAPVLKPSGNISVGYGALAVIRAAGSTFDMTSFYGNFYRLDTTSDYTGNITNAVLYQVNPPLFSGSKPTFMTGMRIENQGVPGITTAIALDINAQSGATNNFNLRSLGSGTRNFFEGNVGIGPGATNPAAKLVVRSDAGTNLIEAYNDDPGALTGIDGIPGLMFKVERATGNVVARGTITGNGGADVAEYVNTTETVEPGDVIEIDPNNAGKFRKARGSMSMRVAGIISTQPGVVLGGNSVAPGGHAGHPAVALAGRVPVKVMAKYGAIEIGDLLVSSPFPGYAMKCQDRNECIGAIIGKAMEPLESGVGKIMVQVMLR